MVGPGSGGQQFTCTRMAFKGLRQSLREAAVGAAAIAAIAAAAAALAKP